MNRNKTVGLQVYVTAVNQLGEMLMHRRNPQDPWKIDKVGLPTAEEVGTAFAVRTVPAYYDAGGMDEYVVASISRSLHGDVYLAIRSAGSSESANGPLLVRPTVRESHSWTPMLKAWLGNKYSLVIAEVPEESKFRKKARPAQVPFRKDISRKRKPARQDAEKPQAVSAGLSSAGSKVELSGLDADSLAAGMHDRLRRR